MEKTGATFWDFLISLNFPIWILVILGVFVFCICKANNLLELSGKIAGIFSGFSKGARKKQISAGIRSSVIKASKVINSSNIDILPKDLKIKWADNDDLVSFFDDNCVVLRLKKSTDPNINYVNVIYHFVVTGLLRNQRHYFNEQILKAADLLITQRIISLAKPSAHGFFLETIYNPQIEGNQSLATDYEYLKCIQFNGMLFNIYLNELAKAAATICDQIPDPCLVSESGEFLRFLYRISMRVTDDETVELNCKFNYFNIGIVLAAKRDPSKNFSMRPYLQYIKGLLNEKHRTIYVLGIGSKIAAAKKIAYAAKKTYESIIKSITHKYTHVNQSSGKRYDAVCIELDTY